MLYSTVCRRVLAIAYVAKSFTNMSVVKKVEIRLFLFVWSQRSSAFVKTTNGTVTDAWRRVLSELSRASEPSCAIIRRRRLPMGRIRMDLLLWRGLIARRRALVKESLWQVCESIPILSDNIRQVSRHWRCSAKFRCAWLPHKPVTKFACWS